MGSDSIDSEKWNEGERMLAVQKKSSQIKTSAIRR